MNTIQKFKGEHGLCLSLEQGLEIRINGRLEGTSIHINDCLWAGYTKSGKFYLSLNNYPGSFWEVTEQEMLDRIKD